MQNVDGRLILKAEVAKNKMAKTTKFARYFGLQHKPSSGRPAAIKFALVSEYCRWRLSRLSLFINYQMHILIEQCICRL